MERELWIGRLEVRPVSTNSPLAGRAGAFVQTIVYARDAEEFELQASATLAELGMEITRIEELDPLDERRRNGTISRDLEILASEVSETNPVAFDDFHAYGH